MGGYAVHQPFSRVKEQMSTMTPIPLPSTLFGYTVIDWIGAGAASQIYAVTDPATRQIYALKHVIRKNDKDDRFIDQLEAEHEVSSKFSHPGLRRTFDLRFERTLLRRVTAAALVMELIDARSLEDFVPSQQALVKICIKAADALHALHQMGYVHCDLKPNNIMVDAKGKVTVIDFGQAARSGTVKERIQGTPDFISPEQVKRDPVTFQTDIFNLGATMYFALAGKKLPTLFTLKKGANSFLVDDVIETPRQANPAVPENLSNLVMECVRNNPAKRPPDMHQVARRLEIILHSFGRIGGKTT